ncbi:Uncharacterised protein [Flavonifractor plautii]|uniref:Uncharacterized protein n=1 Tax=Flavonifractor plautii TaxID=292800 RepID=A0A174WEG4_FLAPL|nr:Uncharacterised protein [Flavonifractor plautii]
MVGGWMPASSMDLATSRADTPVSFFSSSRVSTNSCMHRPGKAAV